MKEQEFFLVWNPNGHAPTHKHFSEDAARAEAERLARVAPGEMFFLMHAVGVCKKTDVEWHGLCQESEIGVPF